MIMTTEDTERPTPETALATYRVNGVDIVWPDFARRLERERDEAREKIERQAERLRQLEGATNHAGGLPKYHGTDETDAMVEQWQSTHIPAGFARRMESERNRARELADERLRQLTAITSSEPRDYLALVTACRVHKDHIAQLAKERDEAIADRDIAKNSAMYSDRAHDRMAKELDGLYKQLDQSRNEYLRVCSERDDLFKRWEAAK